MPKKKKKRKRKKKKRKKKKKRIETVPKVMAYPEEETCTHGWPCFGWKQCSGAASTSPLPWDP